MKNSILCSLMLVFSVLLFSCEGSTDDNLVESSSISLISESGFKIAKSERELKSKLNLDQAVDIFSVKFLESDQAQAAIINYKESDSEELKNVVIATGKINFKASSVEYKQNNTNARSLGGDDTWQVRCTGCEGCIVSGTINPDGSLDFRCSLSCCSAIVTKIEDSPTP